jgi:hypothetical protein
MTDVEGRLGSRVDSDYTMGSSVVNLEVDARSGLETVTLHLTTRDKVCRADIFNNGPFTISTKRACLACSSGTRIDLHLASARLGFGIT